MKNFKQLRVEHLVAADQYVEAVNDKETLTLESKAKSLMQDFSAQAPVTVLASTPLLAARKLATATPTDALLVVDETNRIVGITSSAELQSARITTLAEQLSLKPTELLVNDVMRKLSALPSVPYLTAANAKLGDVLTTMESHGSLYILVTKGEQLVGVLCARTICKTLDIPLSITPVAQSFHDVVTSVNHTI